MYFVRLTTPLDVAPDDILGRVVVHPVDPLRELVPTPAVHVSGSVLARGDVHIRVDRSAALDALLSHTDGGPGIAAALARYGCLYFVEAARTEHGKIVELAYRVILSPGSQIYGTDTETNKSRALIKWMEDHRVPERALGAVTTVAITAAAPPLIGLVIGGGAGFIVSDYVAPRVIPLIQNIIASGATKSGPGPHLTSSPAVGSEDVEMTPAQRGTGRQGTASGSPPFAGGEYRFKRYFVHYLARARARL